MFRPKNAAQLAHLRSVGAVRDPNEAEAALAEKLVPAIVETESTIG